MLLISLENEGFHFFKKHWKVKQFTIKCEMATVRFQSRYFRITKFNSKKSKN